MERVDVRGQIEKAVTNGLGINRFNLGRTTEFDHDPAVQFVLGKMTEVAGNFDSKDAQDFRGLACMMTDIDEESTGRDVLRSLSTPDKVWAAVRSYLKYNPQFEVTFEWEGFLWDIDL